MSCSKRGHWRTLVCGCSLSLACAIDNRPGSIVEMPSGNAGSSNIPTGAAGASDETPGAVPDGPNPSTSGAGGEGAGDGTPSTVLPLNGGGASGNGDAGSASMMMGSSGSGPGSAGTAGAGSIVDPGESEVIGGCFNQLLANAGFERGHTAWTETSEAVHDVIVHRDASLLLQAGITPQAGDYLAWIGGIPSGDFRMYHSTLLQTVAIPAEALSLTMTGYYWVSQDELGHLPLMDWAVLELEDPDPNDLGIWQVQPPFNDQSVTTGWVYFEATTVDAEQVSAGKTLTVRANSVPNGNGTLSVWFDSLRLEARCPR